MDNDMNLDPTLNNWGVYAFISHSFIYTHLNWCHLHIYCFVNKNICELLLQKSIKVKMKDTILT